MFGVAAVIVIAVREAVGALALKVAPTFLALPDDC